ncbi:MAG: DNA gyrase subunit A, partial [Muribaculaceae bacterium]|nr:DNA gyrase subunit A [Muribaculaceae bacterium]
LQVELTDGDAQVILASKAGYAPRFSETELREMGRVSPGLRGMTLRGEGDEVSGMVTAKTDDNEHSILVVSENGFGKRTHLDDYPVSMHRGGKGVKTLNVTDKTGDLVAIKKVTDENDLMIINQSGITLRLPVETLRLQGRNTQGVKLIDLTKRGDRIASVCVVDTDPEEETEEETTDGQATLPETADGSLGLEITETEETIEAEETTATEPEETDNENN